MVEQWNESTVDGSTGGRSHCSTHAIDTVKRDKNNNERW